MQAVAEIVSQDTKHKMLYNILLENTELDYTGEKLTLSGYSIILQVLKCIDPQKYEKRIEQLKADRKGYLKNE